MKCKWAFFTRCLYFIRLFSFWNSYVKYILKFTLCCSILVLSSKHLSSSPSTFVFTSSKSAWNIQCYYKCYNVCQHAVNKSVFKMLASCYKSKVLILVAFLGFVTYWCFHADRVTIIGKTITDAHIAKWVNVFCFFCFLYPGWPVTIIS